jgi:CubicO group peptidase (beta-lactamase class C family)
MIYSVSFSSEDATTRTKGGRMRRILFAIGLIISLTALTTLQPAAAPGTFTEARAEAGDPAVNRRVDDYIQAEMVKQHIPGLALGVYRNGEILKAQGYGFADVKSRIPVNPETLFQSASVGKQFTAVAVLMLMEDQKISLENSITKYFPNAPQNWTPIKIRNLLTHTSGIREYLSTNRLNLKKDYTPEQFLSVIESLPLDFQPGEDWSYSNTNYALLGFIIEKVTGQFYGDFLRDNVFRPLGMSSTQVVSKADAEGIPGRSSGYRFDKGKIKDQEFSSPTFNTTGDGSLYFNVLDLAKWDAALYTEKLLKTSTLDQMWTVAKLNNGSPNRGGYGFGWGIKARNGHKLVEHSGGWLGFTTHIARYADDKLSVVVLTNARDGDPAKIAHVVAEMYEASLEVKAIPDTEPQVTAQFGSMIQNFSSGKPFDTISKDDARSIQKTMAGFGRLQSIELVKRDVKETRNYTYRVSFSELAAFFTINLSAENKLEGLHIRLYEDP